MMIPIWVLVAAGFFVFGLLLELANTEEEDEGAR